MKKKFLHLMPMGSLVYDDFVIKMINDNYKEFNTHEHTFYLMKEIGYNKSKRYSNVFLKENYFKDKLRMLKQDAKSYDYIVMHSLPFQLLHFIFLDVATAKKILWIIWGHDLYNRKKLYRGITLFRKIRRYVYNNLFDLFIVKKIQMFKAIGIGFFYDAVEIKKLFGKKITIVSTPYASGIDITTINKTIQEYKLRTDEIKPIKIMIGHGAYAFLNHEENLKRLMSYANNNIIISIPLTYGCHDYAIYVKKIALELFSNKVEILDKYLINHLDHIKYLASIDIAIFDLLSVGAMGNIIFLLYMGKKLYLNKNGIIKKALNEIKITSYTVDDIGKISFEEFSKRSNVVDNFAYDFALNLLDEKKIKQAWKNTFDSLI